MSKTSTTPSRRGNLVWLHSRYADHSPREAENIYSNHEYTPLFGLLRMRQTPLDSVGALSLPSTICISGRPRQFSGMAKNVFLFVSV